MQIPLPEMVIRALARRMIEVVRPRIDSQLFNKLWIEPGLLEDFGIALIEDRKCFIDELLIHARRDADILYVKRNRANSLVSIRLHLPLGFENSDRPIAQI